MNVNPLETEPIIRERHRSVEYRWPVGDPYSSDSGTAQDFAVLSVLSLHPERKGYVATLRGEKEERREGSQFIATSFMLFAGERIDTLNAPRFSQKGLAEFADNARRIVEARFAADDEAVRKFFLDTEVVAA